MGLILIALTTYFAHSQYAQATPFARALVTDNNIVLNESDIGWMARDPILCKALDKFCVEEGGMDERQIQYCHFEDNEGFFGNLVYARLLYQQMKDAPPLSDATLFPARPRLNEALTFNRQIRKWMEKEKSVYSEGSCQAAAFDAAIRETDRLYQFYDLARDAQCEFYYVNVRRSALMRLRERLGVDVYNKGELPPCVPIWLFTELK